ncbi:MAG: DUF3300 domain-containing protein [Gammaproteobacteria bacterium]|nr:DUF3300 domain-containing protein [Gammaproteobacteria bacterium]MBU2678582.1 DUF3300 domain-containing protein [Gammaproteobacteria bacterium]NNC57548.1 DUF3300 domain-containing protein [Woeseiaceae bacterium]NNL52316.1 DUF3300 domain-containing protein [Woeseiaceae bacterium]
MKNRKNAKRGWAIYLLASFSLLGLLPAMAVAQVPVDENGEIIGEYAVQSSEKTTGNEDIPLLSTVDLEELVGPIALYPDDLLAIVLPASAYPLQIVDAARFLEALDRDPSLEPDPEWDDSVVALLNYPEVIELLNDDIDWTWRLGEAVVSQQADVVGAIETFRDRAYAAGNLKSDSYQEVSRDEGVIEITPVAEDVIYVPYYEPERVVVYQPRPVYYYYPRPYPVYYYPYSASYAFDRGYFWGVTTAYTIGWYSDSLSVFHHSYYGHPYYGRSYRDRWWYRRPTLGIHNTTYVSRNTNITVNRYYGGDRWRPRDNRSDYVSDRRITRNREYPNPRTPRTDRRTNNVTWSSSSPSTKRRNVKRSEPQRREPISFRERPQTTVRDSDGASPTRRQSTRRQERTPEFKERRQDATARRSGATPKLQRGDPAIQTRRRSEPTQQVRRRAEPTTPVSRRAAPTARVQRSESAHRSARTAPARDARRADPVRQAKRAEPQRQRNTERKSAEKKSAPVATARKSNARKSDRRR